MGVTEQPDTVQAIKKNSQDHLGLFSSSLWPVWRMTMDWICQRNYVSIYIYESHLYSHSSRLLG